MCMIPMLYYADRRADTCMAMLLSDQDKTASDAVLSLDLEVCGTVDGIMGASGFKYTHDKTVNTVSQSTFQQGLRTYTLHACKRSC